MRKRQPSESQRRGRVRQKQPRSVEALGPGLGFWYSPRWKGTDWTGADATRRVESTTTESRAGAWRGAPGGPREGFGLPSVVSAVGSFCRAEGDVPRSSFPRKERPAWKLQL